MRKENKHPNHNNFSQHLPKNWSQTPDSITSRKNFRPKFIVKQSNLQNKQQQIQPHSISQNHIEDKISSPTSTFYQGVNIDHSQLQSILQSRGHSFNHSTCTYNIQCLDNDSKVNNNKGENWEKKYKQVQRQLQNRTNKFKQISDLCCTILNDVLEVDIQGTSRQKDYKRDRSINSKVQKNPRKDYTRKKIRMLLESFIFFKEGI